MRRNRASFLTRATLVAVGLNVVIVGTCLAADAPPPVIDWSMSSAQETMASCKEFELRNMLDHESYILWVRGLGSGTCSFRADGLTFHYPWHFSPNTTSTTTTITFTRFGSDVLVAWTEGY